jgi:hypothetical protein
VNSGVFLRSLGTSRSQRFIPDKTSPVFGPAIVIFSKIRAEFPRLFPRPWLDGGQFAVKAGMRHAREAGGANENRARSAAD